MHWLAIGGLILWTLFCVSVGVLLSRRIITTATDLYADLVKEARLARAGESFAKEELAKLRTAGKKLEQKIAGEFKSVVPVFALSSLGVGAAVQQVIDAHPIATVIVLALLIFAIFSAAVQALEKPDATSGKGYRFAYRFAHFLAFNFQYAIRAKFPQYVPDSIEKPRESDEG